MNYFSALEAGSEEWAVTPQAGGGPWGEEAGEVVGGLGAGAGVEAEAVGAQPLGLAPLRIQGVRYRHQIAHRFYVVHRPIPERPPFHIYRLSQVN